MKADAGAKRAFLYGIAVLLAASAALALAAIGLMALAQLWEGWHLQVRSAANLAIALGLVMMLYLVWTMDGNAWVLKGVRVLQILAALGFVCVFVLDRVGRIENAE